ncbi:TRAP transporter small permease subunit [Tepidicella baoligensis]|uniref:TRAP transporter small permease subunit n=1 Tax=Tepidicella baoligensis TaxID=2707016 RepID=UPI0015D985F5|nr:TRAP transporter small permease [Tepidicella baoligensis]
MTDHSRTTPPSAAHVGAADAYNRPLPWGLHWLVQGLNALGTLWIIALMLLINADIIGRTGFNAPVRGVTELVSLSIVGIVFLQLADTLRAGRFTRADVMLDWLKREHPVAAARLQALFHLTGGALMLVILWAAWGPLVESVRIREYVGALGDFMAPVWPVRLIMLVGLSVTALTFVLLAFDDLQRARWLAGRRAGGGDA